MEKKRNGGSKQVQDFIKGKRAGLAVIKGVVFKGLTSMPWLIGKPPQVRRRFNCHATQTHTQFHTCWGSWLPFLGAGAWGKGRGDGCLF